MEPHTVQQAAYCLLWSPATPCLRRILLASVSMGQPRGKIIRCKSCSHSTARHTACCRANPLACVIALVCRQLIQDTWHNTSRGGGGFSSLALAMAQHYLVHLACCCLFAFRISFPMVWLVQIVLECLFGVILAGSQAWQGVVHQHISSDEGSASQLPSCQQSIASAQLASRAQNLAEPDYSTSAQSPAAGNACSMPQTGCMTP